MLSYTFSFNITSINLFLVLFFFLSFHFHDIYEQLRERIQCRCTQIKTYSWDNAQVVLVGNKCDMEDERVISFERGKQLADSLGLEFFETSAKENVNVRVRVLDY